jgi:phosphoadenosine phosphosulfate reductase
LQIPSDVEQWDAKRVVAWTLEQFPGRVALACSFQKEETILLDMLFALEPAARVFAIDTHHLVPETYAYWREVERRYGIAIETPEGAAGEPGLGARNADL